MNTIVQYFEVLMHYLLEYRYVALLVAALVEGPVTSFLAGSLVALGYFNPFIAFGILVFKDLVLDTVFYAIGRLARIQSFAKRIIALRAQTGLTDAVLEAVEQGWRDHPVKLMWAGKLAYGLSAWFLVSAGVAGLSFRKFYIYTLPVTVFQFGVLMVLGYFLGSVKSEVMEWLFWAQLIVFAVVVFFVMRAFARKVRKKFVQKAS